MKRSLIDARIEAGLKLCQRYNMVLPPFAFWNSAQFVGNRASAERIHAAGLGWNVAEFAPGAFATLGLVVFTSRMGDWRLLSSGGGRLYGEKTIMLVDGQRAPHHYHVVKTEDILNRGGARLVIELFKVDAHGRRSNEAFQALKDTEMLRLLPGDRVSLEPGESIVLEPYVAHAFWAEGGDVLAGEVSLANDDATDNYFIPTLSGAVLIDEDAPARYVTVPDMARLLRR